MKKVLSMLCVLLAFTLVGCDKENDVNGNDQPSGGESSGEGEEGAAAEISEISADASVEMDVDWINGVIINVTIAPANASMADVAAEVADESIVSVEKEGNGFRVKPKKVGSTTVKIKATRGAASSKTCSVKVNEKGMTTVVEVTKCELVSGDSMDKRTLQDFAQLNGSFKVKLTPSNAKLADDMTWSADKDWVESMGVQGTNYGSGTYGFEIKLKKNSSHLSNRTGTMNITFKSKKGNASLKVPITVCGHIYKVEFPVLSQTSNDKIENGEIHLTGGESISITPTISQTGTLMSGDGVNYEIPSGYGLSVSSNTLKVSTSPDKWANSGTTISVKDKFDRSLGSFKVHTYAAPAAIMITKVSDGKNSYYKGDRISFNVSVNPSTARQKFKLTTEGYDIVSQTSSTLKVEVNTNGAVDAKKMYVACTANSSITDYASFYVDQYRSTDLKIGDYVVFNSSNSSFRQMDGGVRAYYGGSVRWRTVTNNETLLKPGSLSSSEKIVGIVTHVLTDDSVHQRLINTWNCRLQSFTNVSGGHARVVSMTDGDENRWSDASYTETDFKNWWTGKTGSYMNSLWGAPPAHYPGDYSADAEYRYTQGWIEFNSRMSSATPRVKAVYSAERYNNTTCPIPAPALSNGTTGWLLPVRTYDKCMVSLLNEALTYAGGTKLSGYYWTPCYRTSDNTSYYLDIANGTYGSTSRKTSYPTRPVFWL